MTRDENGGGFNALRAFRDAIDDPDIKGSVLLVAMALIRHANGTGASFPSVSTLGRKLGLGRSTVLRSLAELEAKGLISVDRSPGRKNVYRYHHGTGLTVKPVPPGDGTGPTVTPHQSHGDTTPVSPQDSKVPKKLPKKVPTKRLPAAPDEPLPVEPVQEAYLAARRACGSNGAPDFDWLASLIVEERYHGLDFVHELTSFAEWWSDQRKPPKSLKLAIRSWLRKAIEINADRGRAGAGRKTEPKTAVGGTPPTKRPAIPPDPEAVTQWEGVLNQLEAKYDPHSFNTWLRPTSGVRIDEGGSLIVGVPNDVFHDWLTDNYLDRIERAAGCPVRFECREG